MPSRLSNFATLNLKNGLLEEMDTQSSRLVSFVGAGQLNISAAMSFGRDIEAG